MLAILLVFPTGIGAISAYASGSAYFSSILGFMAICSVGAIYYLKQAIVWRSTKSALIGAIPLLMFVVVVLLPTIYSSTKSTDISYYDPMAYVPSADQVDPFSPEGLSQYWQETNKLRIYDDYRVEKISQGFKPIIPENYEQGINTTTTPIVSKFPEVFSCGSGFDAVCLSQFKSPEGQYLNITITWLTDSEIDWVNNNRGAGHYRVVGEE